MLQLHAISTAEVDAALALMRRSRRFDAFADRIGWCLRFRLSVYRRSGLRLFRRTTVMRLLLTEAGGRRPKRIAC